MSTAWQSQIGQVQSDFQALGKALQSGNLTVAQQAYATLQQDLPASQSSSSATSSNPLSAVGQALQSGNLTAAQQAFAALKGHHHGHHHHGGGSAVSAPASTPTATTGTSLNAVA
jgi:outer membrane protein assembly factor BamD (BamD/ComL family)